MEEPALSAVAEEDEDPEVIAAIEQEQYSAYKNSKTMPRNRLSLAHGTTSTESASSGASERRPTMQPTQAYVKLAETIVDEAYNVSLHNGLACSGASILSSRAGRSAAAPPLSGSPCI